MIVIPFGIVQCFLCSFTDLSTLEVFSNIRYTVLMTRKPINIMFIKTPTKKKALFAFFLSLVLLPFFALSKQELKQIDIKPQTVRIWRHCAMSPRKYKVKMYVYLPQKQKATGAACIIMPGGSYIYMGIYREGKDIAKWLASEGVAGFALSYRTAMQWNHHPAMAQDVQRAIQYIKENAALYNVDENKVGVMGFSAGGHLAGLAAEYFDVNFMNSLGVVPKCNLKPAFCAMIYPVVTMYEPAVHVRSRRHLLGGKRKTPEYKDMMSLEKNTRADMPPVFLVQCIGDKTVDYHNAVMLDESLSATGVNHKFLLYDEEGHGFGADPYKYPGNQAWQWSKEFLPWLESVL